MLSRFSVKKPYTVIVATVLVIILGFVSLTKMNMDLLPGMNMPYAMIMTTYPGASPEIVEETVTKPIEQSMATVSNIKNIASASGESMSLVMLEFESTTNMDSTSLEMREKVDQIKGFWDDSVSNPMIMKLNPNMMPVLVAAVDVDGLSAAELTDYVDQHVMSELESISGVARVTKSGGVTEDVEVRIDPEKLTAVNEEIQTSIQNKFSKEEEKLTDAEKEIQSGKNELESGKDALKGGGMDAAHQMAQGSGELSGAQNELNKSLIEVDLQLGNLSTKKEELNGQLTTLLDTETKLNATLAQLTEQKNSILEAQKAAESMKSGITALDTQIKAMEEQLKGLEAGKPDGMTDEEWVASKESLKTAIGQMQTQKTELQTQLDALQASLPDADTMGKLDEGIGEANEGLQTIAATKAQLNQGLAAITAGETELTAVKEKLEQGQEVMSASQIQLETGKVMATLELAQASSEMAAGSLQLELAQQKLTEGKDQLEIGKDQALEQADLNTILTTDMVKGILAAENFSMPAGYVTEEGKEYLIRVGEKVSDVKDLEDLIVLDLDLDGVEPIRLADVAEINVKDNSSEIYAKINGNPGMMISIEKQTDYSTGEVTDKILDRFEDMEEENPDLGFTTLMDQGMYIDMVLNSVLHNMLYGGLLAIFILFLFLKDMKPTFVIACSIPISVVTALVLMYFSGVTMNIISMSGLALGVGMLVDNSIVVIENIYRMRSMGIPARKAAVEGAKEVSGAIVSSTLTTVCVFAPIVFTDGITRQLFVDMGLTIGYSLAASLVVALSLVPMMSAGLLKKAEIKHAPLLDKAQNVYSSMMQKVLCHKKWVLLGALLLFVASIFLAALNGTEFFPTMESTQASIRIATEKGTSLEETSAKADQVIEQIQDLEDIETIGAAAGGAGMAMGMGGTTNEVTVYLVLSPDKKLTGEELKAEILKRTEEIKDCEITVSTSNMDMSMLGGSGVQVEVYGKDLEKLQTISEDIEKELKEIKGTENVSDSMEDTEYQYKIIVDKAKAMSHGLTTAQVFQEINKKIAEAQSATIVSTDTKDYNVYVKDEKDEGLTREELGDLTIEVKDPEGKKEEITVSDIADFEDSVSPQSINRYNQSRYMTVTADVASGYNIGLVSRDVQKMLDGYQAPAGYTLKITGEDESINEAMSQLSLMLALAIVFMYLIMVAQFQSLLSPFIIMFTIPLAFTGGFLGLLVTNKPVSIIAMIGFVMLSGIIVNNGIVLVDYINQLQKKGMEKHQAIIQAGCARLRPIIMTALTTILGLLTMAFGIGMGADMVQPMAIVTIGGLLYGTILTLFVVPCIYDILNRRHYVTDESRLVDQEEK